MTVTNTTSNAGKKDEVSLGPACFVIVIFFLIAVSLFFVYMSIVMMGNSGKRASRAIREQLIPWIEQSHLGQSDRKNVIDRLETLTESMDREELSSRQLSRLNARLSESSILQWGTVEKLQQIAQSSELTEGEKSEFTRLCDRWLRCASEGKLSMQDMEFALQQVCTKAMPSGRLDPKPDIDLEKLREFMRRVGQICERFKIPDEDYTKSVSQVFQQMIEDGLNEK
jgi:hypothetical protein